MQEELSGPSVELGSMEPPHPTSSDLIHLGESRCWPHRELQPGLRTGERRWRTGALCPAETMIQQR